VVKVLHDDLAENAELCQRFVEAAELLAGVRHANVGRVLSVHGHLDADTSRDPFSADSDSGPVRPCYVTPALAGRSLEVELQRRTFNVEVACEIGVQICLGLLACEEQALLHCNLKPSNVWVTADDAGVLRAQLLDVGITAAVYEDALAPHAARWAQELPRYQAPELLLGHRATPSADVYSVGAILYEMLCGSPVIEEKDELAALKAVMCGQWSPLVSRNPNLPEPLIRAVEAALVVNPEERFGNALPFLRQLLAQLSPDSAIATEARAWLREHEPNAPVGLSDPATSLRVQTPKHRMVSAIPSGQLVSPVFPKAPPAPRFSRAPASLPSSVPAPPSLAVELALPMPVAEAAGMPLAPNRLDLVAVFAGLGLGVALVWLQVAF
jgi:serine/threonine protein kinase